MINKALGLLKRIGHLLPHWARLLSGGLVLPLFDYGDLIWGDKDNIVLMENLQIPQNKAAKVILDRSLHSSATDALKTLGWRKLTVRRFYHRCLPKKLVNTTQETNVNYIYQQEGATGEAKD